MVYATNVAGHPIYGTVNGVVGAPHVRLLEVAGVVTMPDGITLVNIHVATGNSEDNVGHNALIPQPPANELMQTMIADMFGRTPGTVDSDTIIDYSK